MFLCSLTAAQTAQSPVRPGYGGMAIMYVETEHIFGIVLPALWKTCTTICLCSIWGLWGSLYGELSSLSSSSLSLSREYVVLPSSELLIVAYPPLSLLLCQMFFSTLHKGVGLGAQMFYCHVTWGFMVEAKPFLTREKGGKLCRISMDYVIITP